MADVLVARLKGSGPGPVRIGDVFTHISLGRHDGVGQFTRAPTNARVPSC
ncbi:hypothetical protein [Streptomyces melanogenes]